MTPVWSLEANKKIVLLHKIVKIVLVHSSGSWYPTVLPVAGGDPIWSLDTEKKVVHRSSSWEPTVLPVTGYDPIWSLDADKKMVHSSGNW